MIVTRYRLPILFALVLLVFVSCSEVTKTPKTGEWRAVLELLRIQETALLDRDVLVLRILLPSNQRPRPGAGA